MSKQALPSLRAGRGETGIAYNDGMDWQWIIVIGSVALAAAYVGRATLKTWRPRGEGCCGGGCGCASKAPPPATLQQLEIRGPR